jgi:Lipocalin-like domain
MKIRFALLSALTFLLLACNSSTSSDEDGKGGSKSDMLVGKNWKMTALVLDPGYNINGVTVTDFYAQLPACRKDGTTKFLANGTYADDEGTLKCSASDPQTTTGTWVFNPTETVLTLSPQGDDAVSYDIVTLTSTSLVISTNTNDWDDGLVHKETYTFVAQ